MDSADLPTGPQPPTPPKWHWARWVAVIVTVVITLGLLMWWLVVVRTPSQTQPVATIQKPATAQGAPSLTAEPIASGYDHIWDIAFLQNQNRDILFTERNGKLHITEQGKAREIAQIEDVYARGEGGLMGLTIDPAFHENRFIYACFNSTKGGPDVRVVRWRLNTEATQLLNRTDIVTGIPSSVSGRHSGCRIAFGYDGQLWIGTGDAAQGDTGMQPKNLGGKILRVDRNGEPAPGNVRGEFDARIYSYGHRNVQGIAFFPVPLGYVGVSVEHGSTVDDEINLLTNKNFGWAPAPGGYNESGVPMTDKQRFPDAQDAMWRSGSPTQAPSGATFITGEQWKNWNGSLIVATLKAKHLKRLAINDDYKISTEEKLFENEFGRLRTAVQGPDGNLYITTDNGGNDQIIRVSPK